MLQGSIGFESYSEFVSTLNSEVVAFELYPFDRVTGPDQLSHLNPFVIRNGFARHLN